jgi:hypothetical protein
MISRAHLVLWIRGAVAINCNVGGNDKIPSILSLVDDISQFSLWMDRSSGESGVHGCKMYTQYQELTLFCGFGVTPWPKTVIEVGKSYGYSPVKWKDNSIPGFRRDSGKIESEIIVNTPKKANGSPSLRARAALLLPIRAE